MALQVVAVLNACVSRPDLASRATSFPKTKNFAKHYYEALCSRNLACKQRAEHLLTFFRDCTGCVPSSELDEP